MQLDTILAKSECPYVHKCSRAQRVISTMRSGRTPKSAESIYYSGHCQDGEPCSKRYEFAGRRN